MKIELSKLSSIAVATFVLQLVIQTAPVDAKPFQPADYPESSAKTFTVSVPNSKVSVEALQVKRLNEKHPNPRYCRAWVTITNDGKKVSTEYFNDINGLGGPCGLYFPKQPISDNYRGIVKLGDYDGRLLLVNNAGKYWNLPGGSFFTSKDKKLLFSTHECDAPAGLLVFDLQKGATIFATSEKGKEVPPVVDKWYFDGENYFFTALSTDQPKAAVNKDSKEIYLFDSKAKKLIKKNLPQAKLPAATQVAYDFNAMSEPDLKAAEQGTEIKAPTKDRSRKKEVDKGQDRRLKTYGLLGSQLKSQLVLLPILIRR